jgi:hypothetical protein
MDGIMLCDLCKVKEAVHKMKRGMLGPGKKEYPGHFCDDCYELVSQKIGPGLPVKKPVVHPRKTNGTRHDRPFQT